MRSALQLFELSLRFLAYWPYFVCVLQFGQAFLSSHKYPNKPLTRWPYLSFLCAWYAGDDTTTFPKASSRAGMSTLMSPSGVFVPLFGLVSCCLRSSSSTGNLEFRHNQRVIGRTFTTAYILPFNCKSSFFWH